MSWFNHKTAPIAGEENAPPVAGTAEAQKIRGCRYYDDVRLNREQEAKFMEKKVLSTVSEANLDLTSEERTELLDMVKAYARNTVGCQPNIIGMANLIRSRRGN